ncbi:MAG: peptidoglycan-binding domain-containing protein, partial [Actinobacteria bacterium]|nr:peptidoglycan-binding domain-containing protein [Actinomycetota bacterium]
VITGFAPAQASTTATHPRGSAYQVCDFADPTVPQGNRRYPFSFLLTTRLESTANRNIREAVKAVQEVLRAESATSNDGRDLTIDGKYGAKTRQAVMSFQRRNRLTVDGKVGQQTWSKLASKCWKFH